MSADWDQLIRQTRSRLAQAPGFSSGPINVGNGERAVSAGAGLALVGIGLRRRDGWGAAAALGGLVLLHRGYTGYCAVGDLIGRDSADGGATAGGVSAERLHKLPASPEAVYEAWAHPDTRGRLLRHIVSMEPMDDGRSRWTPRLTAQALGLPDSVVCERVIDHCGQAIAWRSVGDSPVGFQLTVGIEPVGEDISHARVSVAWRPAPDTDPRRLHPDLAAVLDADLERAGGVLMGLLTPRGDDALSPRTVTADSA